MKKAQKKIILIASVIVLCAIIYPPYVFEHSKHYQGGMFIEGKEIETGWDWIFNIKSVKKRAEGHPFVRNDGIDRPDFVIEAKRIRFGVLLIEILSIVILAGFFVLIFRKKK